MKYYQQLAVLLTASNIPIRQGFVLTGTSQQRSPHARKRIVLGSILTTDKSSTPVPKESAEVDVEQFQWFKQWYPLVPTGILDPEKPSKFTLLGMDLVVWNDGKVEGSSFQSKKKRPRGAKKSQDGQWRVFVDECPHRKVPLSEGRVEDDGSLLCSYHAWRFDGQGACIAVPQAADAEKIRNNPKSKCNAFPTTVKNGLLWVWPSSDVNAVLESSLSQPQTSPADEEDPSEVWVAPWNYRELPYGADFFLENVVDPAHVTVSHHNIVGDRYGDQTAVFETITPLSKSGFKISSMNPNLPKVTRGGIEFKAPGLVDIVGPIDGGYQNLQLYVSPSRPGFCNHVGRMVIRKDAKGKVPAPLKVFTLPMPTWLNHVLASAFLNQDGLFLHYQERSLSKTGQYKAHEFDENEKPYNFNKAILPVEADLGVVTFRNWLRLLAGGKIPYKHNPSMPEPSNDVVFDVWNAHTKHCRYCLDALSNIKKLRFGAFFLAASVSIVRPSCLGRIGNLAASLGFTGLGVMLTKLIKLFYRFEFSHAHND